MDCENSCQRQDEQGCSSLWHANLSRLSLKQWKMEQTEWVFYIIPLTFYSITTQFFLQNRFCKALRTLYTPYCINRFGPLPFPQSCPTVFLPNRLNSAQSCKYPAWSRRVSTVCWFNPCLMLSQVVAAHKWLLGRSAVWYHLSSEPASPIWSENGWDAASHERCLLVKVEHEAFQLVLISKT